MKRGRGRPPGDGFKPSDEQRAIVVQAAIVGIPEDRIVFAIINPKTGRPISPHTLRKHFRKELDRGLVMGEIKGGTNLLNLTETNAACAIFFAKCRLGMREIVKTAPIAPSPGSAAAEAEKLSMLEVGRRIAFTLALAVEEQQAK